MPKNPNAQRHTRASDGANIRPWAAGIEADHPLCVACTWVRVGGKFKLKFVNRSCGQHGKLR